MMLQLMKDCGWLNNKKAAHLLVQGAVFGFLEFSSVA